jgi:hypothetical protein
MQTMRASPDGRGDPAPRVLLRFVTLPALAHVPVPGCLRVFALTACRSCLAQVKAQEWKHTLEERQRHDRKMRKEGGGHEH